ncbi:MAG TPA: 16S rRNA (guanine(966)-N(2))-methyltransferase RsmD [Actinomycetota bacterium]|nr:16S rRNA (guanine(966)-N(2))-methyltransferase RsmD [Actinomycetota bacterium]
MRVIAGEAKGRRLAGLRRGDLRPTTDRVREALFSALGPAVPGAQVLDLFAGSGAVGIEALSRGAASAVFVDADPEAITAIRHNLDMTGLASRATIHCMTAQRFVSGGAGPAGGPFDLVFLDPPYGAGFPTELLGALATSGMLSHNAELIVESAALGEAPPVAGLAPLLLRRYGDTSLLFLTSSPERV